MKRFVRKMGMVGLALFYALAGVGVAYAFTASTVTWAGAASIGADAGANGSDAISMPTNTSLGGNCVITSPGGTGYATYTVNIIQQVSNDNLNWSSVDAGFFPGNGQTISDAGPYVLPFVIPPLPFQYERIAVVGAVGSAGQLTCSIGHP